MKLAPRRLAALGAVSAVVLVGAPAAACLRPADAAPRPNAGHGSHKPNPPKPPKPPKATQPVRCELLPEKYQPKPVKPPKGSSGGGALSEMIVVTIPATTCNTPGFPDYQPG